MGTLTDDLTRLRAEINALRENRSALQNALTQNILQLKGDVAELRSGFRQAHADMAANGRNSRVSFVTDLSHQVAGLLGAVADDLKGAREAWIGSAVSISSGQKSRSVAQASVTKQPVVENERVAVTTAVTATEALKPAPRATRAKSAKSPATGSRKKGRQSVGKE